MGRKDSKLNILIVTPWYPNPVHTQDGNFVRAQAEALARTHTVEVLCVYEGAVVKGAGPRVRGAVEKSGVRVVRAGYPGCGGRPARVLRRRRAWRAVLARRTLVPDLIHAHVLVDGGIIGQRLAAQLGVPFVVTEHSHRWLEEWPTARRPDRWLARRAARRAAAVIAVSPALKTGLQRHGISGAITVIPNVVVTEHFYPEAPDPERAFTFVHVSDFSANKRLGDLVAAFAGVLAVRPDVKLRIAGNGDRAALEQLVRTTLLQRTAHPRAAAPINVPQTGAVTISGPHQPVAVGQLMRRADAFVLTSALETQSLVVAEALLSGLPVISTRSGGPEAFISSAEHGLLTPVGDVDALQTAMRQLVDAGPSVYAERTRRRQKALATFGRVGAILERLYDRLLGGR